MRIDRRQFLVSATAAAVGCKAAPDDSDTPATPLEPAPVRAASPPPATPDLPEDPARFPRGVAVGDPTASAALAIVHTDAASVDLVWKVADGDVWVDGGRQDGLTVVDGHVRSEITGLPADAAITVWAEADGASSRPTRFRTAPTTRRRIRIGATSCMGGSNGGMDNLTFVPERDLDLMLLLGDTVYADGSVTREDYDDEWRRRFETASVRDLFAGAAVVATWDDHEVANNWTFGPATSLQDHVEPEQLAAATASWRAAIPMREGPAGSGVWRTVGWGPDLDLFVMDCRGEREDDRIIGDAQMAWILDALTASTARFKLVLVSVHMTDHFELMSVIADVDRWQGHPAERAQLVAAAAGIPGVLFITGDMHFGSIQRVDPEGGPGAALYEVAAGPSGSRLFPVVAVAEAVGGIPPQYDLLLDDWSWSELELDPGLGEVTVRFVGNDGTVLVEQVLTV